MRTTLTLDDDVAAALKRLRKARDVSFKEVVNETLRLGLRKTPGNTRRPRRTFRTRSVSLGACKIGSIDSTADALAIAEGESFR